MKVSRRRLFQSLALTGGYGSAAERQAPGASLEALRHVSTAHGANLTDGRLRVLQPVLERRVPHMRALRDFAFADTVEPTQGILNR